MKALNLAAFVVGLIGFACAITGVALVSVPAALIAGGSTAILWSAFTARAIARVSKSKA